MRVLYRTLREINELRTTVYGFLLRKGFAGRLERGAHLNEGLPPLTPCESGSWFPFFLDECEKKQCLDVLAVCHPDRVEETLGQAEEILRHRISVLGRSCQVGDHINWHLDYLSGHQWPLTNARRGRATVWAADGSDIKYPWELSRFHQGVVLGKAYALSGDERFTREFIDQLNDWIKSNPPYLGVNWMNAMEAGIRAVNLMWTAFFLSDSPLFTPQVRRNLERLLFIHGFFIRHNLEISRRPVNGVLEKVSGNHYLADVVGLLFISLGFPRFHSAPRWLNLAKRELFSEIRKQVDEEGVHYEYCPNYQRLVLEMVLSGLIYLRTRGTTLPEDVLDRVSKMVRFTSDYTKPDGTFPLVRDIDNGRFHILGSEDLKDHRHVVATGTVFLDESRPLTKAGYEDVLWLLGPAGYDRMMSLQDRIASIKSTGYPKSGFYILRSKETYLFVTCSPVGMEGYCGHTHNDFLSFDLFTRSRDLICDSGSYVYGRDVQWRNRFRSTRYHNTICIDGREQNYIDEANIFHVGSHVKPEVITWETSRDRDLLVGQYSVSMGNGAVIHRRTYYFDKQHEYCIIKDLVSGTGLRTIETFFHFGEGVVVEINGGTLSAGSGKGPDLFLISLGDGSISPTVVKGWVSSLYGVKSSRPTAVYRYRGGLPVERSYVLVSLPEEMEGIWKEQELMKYEHPLPRALYDRILRDLANL